MTLIKRKKNGNGNLFPDLTRDFFDTGFFRPGLVNFENLVDTGLKMPPANISENEKEFRIDLSAPGLKRDDFNIEVENGSVVISCEKKTEEEEEKENYHRKEFSYNSFMRRFDLPENINEDKINAKYDNGMLHITIPKNETAIKKQKKSIKVS
jgi:HSP20 family protein